MTNINLDNNKNLNRAMESYEEYKEETKRENYINTHEYNVMLVLRNIGVQLTYEQAKQFLSEAEDRSIDFGTKHPISFTDEEIIEEYNRYFK